MADAFTPASHGEWVRGAGRPLLLKLEDVNPISGVVVSLVARTFASIWASRFCSSFRPARIAESSALTSEEALDVAPDCVGFAEPPETRRAILSAIKRACSSSVLI